MENMTLSDIAAVTRDRDELFGGNGLIILILFFLFFGMNGWGGRNECVATTTQLYDATNQQNVYNSLNGIKEAVCAGTYENARVIDQVNYNGMQNTNTITQALNSGFDGVANQLTALGYQMSQCCCDLKTQMLQDKYDDVRYQLEQANTAVANAVQTQNILGNLGRFVTNPPYYGGYPFSYGTTIA